MTISHEVPVLALACFPFLYPRPIRVIEKEIVRFVDKGPAILGKYTVFEWAVLTMLGVLHPCLGLKVTFKTVKSTESTLEMPFCSIPGFHVKKPSAALITRLSFVNSPVPIL